MATRKVLSALTFATTLVCLLLAAAPATFADSHARIVRLSDIEGSVQIDRNTGQGFEKAIMNMPITQGMRLETGESGRAEVEFENGSVMRLAEDSTVQFAALSMRDDGQRLTEARLESGTAYVNYKHKGGDDFRLDIANQTINLDHDVHFRLRLSSGAAEIAVLKGELKVPGNGGVAKVKKDETFNLDLNDGARYTLAKGVSSFGADDWDSERTSYNSQYASNYNRNQIPVQYGYSDLNYYGSFFNAPGYGTLWRPFGASAMWDPFGDGAWAYYPGSGYTWVSGYPWGWTPYRYGTWLYVPSYGWSWQPGGWNTWNTYPVVANAPATWHQPRPPIVTPAHGGSSTVIVGNPVFTRPTRPAGNHGAGMPPAFVAGRGNANTNAGRPARTVDSTATAAGNKQSTAANGSAATQPAKGTTTGAARPSRSAPVSSPPAAARTPTPPPAAHPTPAPAQRPAPARSSSMSSPRSIGMAPMHSGGMAPASAPAAGHPRH